MTDSDIRIHYVNFGSEGPPYDQGLALGESARQLSELLQNKSTIVTSKSYTPRKIIEEFGHEAGWCVTPFPDSAQISRNMNPNYHKVGMGGWRPFIIFQTLLKANDGDIVALHDVNFHKIPQLKYAVENLDVYVSTIVKFWKHYKLQPIERIFSPMHKTNHQLTRSEIYDSILVNPVEELESYNTSVDLQAFSLAPVGRARMIVVEKNADTMKFFDLFVRLCRQYPEFLISNAYADRGYFHGKFFFCHNCAEQTIFNTLAWKCKVFHTEHPLMSIGKEMKRWDWGEESDSGFSVFTQHAKIKGII